MRKAALLAAGLIMSGAPPANAVDLKDCSKGTTDQRLTCLQANTVLLNKSYETVITELRQNAVDLKKAVADLQEKLDKIKIPDLSNVVRRNDTVKLGFDQSRCLSYPSGVRGVVMGSDPLIQAQLLLLLQDCNGSPQLTFR